MSMHSRENGQADRDRLVRHATISPLPSHHPPAGAPPPVGRADARLADNLCEVRPHPARWHAHHQLRPWRLPHRGPRSGRAAPLAQAHSATACAGPAASAGRVLLLVDGPAREQARLAAAEAGPPCRGGGGRGGAAGLAGDGDDAGDDGVERVAPPVVGRRAWLGGPGGAVDRSQLGASRALQPPHHALAAPRKDLSPRQGRPELHWTQVVWAGSPQGCISTHRWPPG